MKRAFVGLFSLIFFAGASLRAADAVALAAQQEAAENIKRFSTTLEELQAGREAQRRQIEMLQSELSKLRDEVARNNNDVANKESIRRLSEQIAKVDETRLADNRRFQEALERLGETFKKTMNARPAPASTDVSSSRRPAPPRNTGAPGGGGGTEEGFEYIVVSNDRPEKIAAKYQAEKINVTAADIVKGNPSVDWTKLKIGQKLFIPKPK